MQRGICLRRTHGVPPSLRIGRICYDGWQDCRDCDEGTRLASARGGVQVHREPQSRGSQQSAKKTRAPEPVAQDGVASAPAASTSPLRTGSAGRESPWLSPRQSATRTVSNPKSLGHHQIEFRNFQASAHWKIESRQVAGLASQMTRALPFVFSCLASGRTSC